MVMEKIDILGSRFQVGIFKSKMKKVTGVTDRYGWKFIRAAWLFFGILAAAGLLIDYNETCQSFLNQNFGIHILTSLLIIPVYLVELGMTFAFWVKLSPKGARLMGGIGILALIFYVLGSHIFGYESDLVYNYSVSYLRAAHSFKDIKTFLISFVPFSIGAYIQGRFGNKLYSGKTVTICLAIIFILFGIRFTTEYGTFGAFLGTCISYIIILPALSRSRLFYKISRPTAIKMILLIFVLSTLTYIAVIDSTYDGIISKSLAFMLAPFIVINLPRILTASVKWMVRWMKEY